MYGIAISTLGCMSELFLAVYFIITLSDLESDIINSTKCCQQLNRVFNYIVIYFGNYQHNLSFKINYMYCSIN